MRNAQWVWPVVLGGVALLVYVLGPPGSEALTWKRELSPREPWRLFGAHFVHLDLKHLALNLAGLVALWALVGKDWRWQEWGVIGLLVALGIGVGLHVVAGIEWYVGLSGLLHGLLAAGAVGMWRYWRTGALAIIGFLILKAIGETLFQSSAIVEAHWLGSVAGLLAGIIAGYIRRRTTP